MHYALCLLATSYQNVGCTHIHLQATAVADIAYCLVNLNLIFDQGAR